LKKSKPVELSAGFDYNGLRGFIMIESFSDYISAGILALLLVGVIVLILRLFFHHRRQKLIEEEIEYYQEW
jgi:hypothetical protein